ncbi:MAG TPA: hemerythrin domain-containing protein [Casimicrobiaceae bacterium]|nr:hemerythrin domain-containing protein [Casimicrobiaceae bacterium]
MNATDTMTKMAPRVTTMIRMDHTHVLATFHKYRYDTAPDKKKALVDHITDALSVHAQLEEEIFYPAMRDAAPDVIGKSFPEHGEMKRKIADLRTMAPGTPSYDDTVYELMRAVIHHVADEETILLPAAERTIPERLEELGWAMTRRRFELVGPRAGQMAVNVARSYPALVLGAGAVVILGALMAVHGTRNDWQKSVQRPARRLLSRMRA